MSKYVELFNYLKQCPQLSTLWTIGGNEEIGSNVIMPQGSSALYNYQEQVGIYNDYACEIVPLPSVYEDYQINAYRYIDNQDSSDPDSNINVLNLDEVQAICDWITEQNDSNNLPEITGKKVVSIECNPFVPQIRAVDVQANTICYFITLRIRYVNTLSRKCREYDG